MIFLLWRDEEPSFRSLLSDQKKGCHWQQLFAFDVDDKVHGVDCGRSVLYYMKQCSAFESREWGAAIQDSRKPKQNRQERAPNNFSARIDTSGDVLCLTRYSYVPVTSLQGFSTDLASPMNWMNDDKMKNRGSLHSTRHRGAQQFCLLKRARSHESRVNEESYSMYLAAQLIFLIFVPYGWTSGATEPCHGKRIFKIHVELMALKRLSCPRKHREQSLTSMVLLVQIPCCSVTMVMLRFEGRTSVVVFCQRTSKSTVS